MKGEKKLNEDLDRAVEGIESLIETYEKQRIRLAALGRDKVEYHEMDSFLRGLSVALGVVTAQRKS